MSIDRAAVEHVARLAHVGLKPEEVEEFAVELSSVLNHMRNLETLDTSGVEPTAHAVAIDNVMRDDEIRPSWPPQAVLANAPHRVDDLFEVQAVLD